MKTVTTVPTANPNEYLVTVDNDGVVHSFITTVFNNTANINIYEAGIVSNTDQLDTASHVNGQISGEFYGENASGNYEYRLDKKYGDMTPYFTAGNVVTLFTEELDETDPENPVPYPPLITTANGSYFSQDGIDEYGIPIFTTKVTLADDISAHEWYKIIKTI